MYLNLSNTSWWDWRAKLPWTISPNILIHLGAKWTNTREPLNRVFNTLNSYKIVGRPLEPHQNTYSWVLRRYKKGTKAIVKAPTARNHKVLYIHFGQRQTKYIETPKSTHSYSDILSYSLKASLYWLWHWTRCGRHHIGDQLEGAISLYLQRHGQGLSSIWMHLRRLTICTSLVWRRLWRRYFHT